MNKKGLVATLTVTLLIVVLGAAYLVAGARPHLGLDLRGGISAVYTPVIPEGREVPEDFDAVLDQTIEVIRTRVDSLGVAEPDISRQGDDVMVQLPGVQDADRMREIIGTTAKLTFRPVEEIIQPGDEAYEEGPPCDLPADEREELPDDEPREVELALGDLLEPGLDRLAPPGVPVPDELWVAAKGFRGG